MNKIFKFFIFCLIVEILLGYIIYIKSSTLETGHYISSTIIVYEKLTRKLKNIISFKNDSKIEENLKKKKELIDNNHEKRVTKFNCNSLNDKNITANIAGFNTYRQKIIFQSNFDFLNSFNSKKDYLVLILGNSETFGNFLKNQNNRIHSVIQKKLKNRINFYLDKKNKTQKGKIFVVNISRLGGMISDHLTEFLNFSNIYSPDLAIFYTGGNEIDLYNFFNDVLNKEIYSIKNNKFYSFANDENIKLNECLDKLNFVSKKNFHNINLTSNVDDYIRDNFFKIENVLSKKSINFLFYIQPLRKIEYDINTRSINHKKIESILIDNKKFINLNLNNKNLKLDYIDAFHTTNYNQISDIITDDIWENYKNDIEKKIID